MEIRDRECWANARSQEHSLKRSEVEEVKEISEVKEVKDVKERSAGENGARVAAFFDLDGTLMAGPSLERRFFRMLRYRRAIGVRNYFLWLGEAMRLAPRGIAAILQANKKYLRGVRVPEGDGGTGLAGRGTGRMCIPAFFPAAVKRVAWHASQGHAIVIVSGTLEPLAREAARAMEEQIAMRRIAAEVHALATRLEEAAGSWTGRIAGEAMFGEEKGRALRKLAGAWDLDLARSYAYGNSVNDRWMLAAVGRATAVNAGEELRRIARLYGWPEAQWKENRSEARGPLEVSRTVERHLEEKGLGIAGEEQTLRKNEPDGEKIDGMNVESLG
jgi:HAD superfamily hydrolase (TIGR01490 family)